MFVRAMKNIKKLRPLTNNGLTPALSGHVEAARPKGRFKVADKMYLLN